MLARLRQWLDRLLASLDDAHDVWDEDDQCCPSWPKCGPCFIEWCKG